MIEYQPEDLRTVKFHGRLIYVLQYPEWEEEGVVLNHIVDQLGFIDHKDDLLMTTLYDLKYLAQVVHVQDQGELHELVVIPITKLNAWLFNIRIPKGEDAMFSQEVLTADGEIIVETVSVRENLAKYQAECCAVLYSYWNSGIAINPNVGQPFASLASLWVTARANRENSMFQFCDYAEKVGEDLSVSTLRHGIIAILSEFLPQSLVLKPEESKNGFDLYRLALAEDFIARYFATAIIEEASPTQILTTLDTDLIVAFHSIAHGFLQAVNDWQLSIPGK